jgi:hypothetical protein
MTSEDLDQMWEDEQKDRDRSPKNRLDDLIRAIQTMQRILDAMQSTCSKIEDAFRGKNG